MPETIFRLMCLLWISDFTTRVQNVNISLYLLHLMQTCCELRRLQEIPLPGPCRKSHCLGPAGNLIASDLHVAIPNRLNEMNLV